MARSSDSQAQLWERRLRQFEASSMTVVQFCQSVGCSLPTFYNWRRKLQKPRPSAFLQIEAPQQDSRIELHLPGGVVLMIPADAIELLPRILKQVV